VQHKRVGVEVEGGGGVVGGVAGRLLAAGRFVVVRCMVSVAVSVGFDVVCDGVVG